MIQIHIALFVAVVGCLSRVQSIMVPTGKLGPITPPKPMAPIPQPYQAALHSPAPVWERIDEGDNTYKPYVYKYILWDYVQKYGHHTLVAHPEDYYGYNPIKTVDDFIYKNEIPQGKGSYSSYSKNKMYYSPLQFL